jgi:hypothetical protein
VRSSLEVVSFCSVFFPSSVDMASLYEFLITLGVLEKDSELLDAMKKRIEEEIKKLDEK